MCASFRTKFFHTFEVSLNIFYTNIIFEFLTVAKKVPLSLNVKLVTVSVLLNVKLVTIILHSCKRQKQC